MQTKQDNTPTQVGKKKSKKKITYKVTTNLADNDFYTDDEAQARKMFEKYIEDYGDGIRLYEAEKTKATDDAPEWDTIDSFDEDNAEWEEPTQVGKITEGLTNICGSVVPWSEIERVWREHCKKPEPTQVGNEVLHTRGEWYVVENFPTEEKHDFQIVANCKQGSRQIAQILKSKANAYFICKAVNNYSKLVEENERLKKALRQLHEQTCEIEDYGCKLSNGMIDEIVKANKFAETILNNAKNL